MDVKRELEEKGYCVVEGVLDANSAQTYANRFWDWIEQGSNHHIDRANSRTWTSDVWPHNAHGIIHHYGIAHAPFVWDLRQESRIAAVFEQIWGTSELLVSFDGACVGKPIKRAERPWPHVDQGSNNTGFKCVQGFVNLLPCGDNDGGLVVYEGSHKKHGAFFAQSGTKSKGDWYKFKGAEMDFYVHCPPVKVNCKTGDLVLWDSRCVHYARCPGKGSDAVRMVIYICMTPRALCTAASLRKKQAAFANRRTTSHWPHKIKMQAKEPPPFSAPPEFHTPTEDAPTLSVRGKQLAGLIPY